jgi:hypothetical protein
MPQAADRTLLVGSAVATEAGSWDAEMVRQAAARQIHLDFRIETMADVGIERAARVRETSLGAIERRLAGADVGRRVVAIGKMAAAGIERLADHLVGTMAMPARRPSAIDSAITVKAIPAPMDERSSSGQFPEDFGLHELLFGMIG